MQPARDVTTTSVSIVGFLQMEKPSATYVNLLTMVVPVANSFIFKGTKLPSRGTGWDAICAQGTSIKNAQILPVGCKDSLVRWLV